ncbi:cytochrome bd-I ubiquinol oxidase subunit 2 apoprotein (plasmid) [Paraburkholderia caribensis MBA4]|uniref:Cytochrome bd-I ubiquinol oxidase subunit 2 apoprotein n=1 Tax=Paraburkholderia caribensis MBA4 TaxID=1323664 RepID=A0A0P0RN43_9BURK|nr:cytochrome d ubiquinol oxidase subunit II [Paraburkholderia caribensis]ALL70324.1 cytochrome bd-I ubiquinol oxidase subunit 2 apoprotein [Paraburkholderia caribensis MBA4]
MLTWLWIAELAFALAAYVVLDGFDLGVGILSGFIGNMSLRDEMLATISPVWDGNGTWLVIAGTIMWGAFPPVYSIVLPALYIPLAVMLIGLIMRGVAIEFSHRAGQSRWVWDMLLFVGSLLAAFMQGVSVGTYAQGLPVSQLRYTGTGLEWCSAFPLWCGTALVLGYVVLGAGWLVLKGEGRLQQFGRTAASRLAPLAMLFAASIFVTTLVAHREVEARWLAHPALFVLPLLCLLTFFGSSQTARSGSARLPYALAAASCLLLLLTLAASLLPYVVPFDVTIFDAAAPESTQKFMFWGAGLFVLPLIVVYTYVAYWVFRGKVSREHGYH